MRAFLVVLTIAVVAFLAWVAWRSHIAGLYAVAHREWNPPEQVWLCVGAGVFCADRPAGPRLDVDLTDFEPDDTSCGHDPVNPTWIRLAPCATIEARRALGAPQIGDDPVFDRSKETRVVGKRTWLRWDLRSSDPR